MAPPLTNGAVAGGSGSGGSGSGGSGGFLSFDCSSAEAQRRPKHVVLADAIAMVKSLKVGVDKV